MCWRRWKLKKQRSLTSPLLTTRCTEVVSSIYEIRPLFTSSIEISRDQSPNLIDGPSACGCVSHDATGTDNHSDWRRDKLKNFTLRRSSAAGSKPCKYKRR